MELEHVVWLAEINMCIFIISFSYNILRVTVTYSLSDDDITTSWGWWWLQVSDGNLLQVLELLVWLASNDVWILVHVKSVLIEWESWCKISSIATIWILVLEQALIDSRGSHARESVGRLVLAAVTAGRRDLVRQDAGYFAAVVV